MTRSSLLPVLGAILTVVLALVYQLQVKPILTVLGVGRVIEAIGNDNCVAIPDLQACEKIVLHQPSGVLYLACSTPSSRVHWTPACERLNVSGRSSNDYVATYDPVSSSITRLDIEGFPGTRGLSLHGMDVVASSSDPNQLFVYLINHRAPLRGDARDIGTDSCVEIFNTTVGGKVLTYLHTVEDPAVIVTPNDLVGTPDGRSFYFTNDHGEKTGFKRALEAFGRKSSSVGFCHIDRGCKFAATGISSANGIATANNGTFYVASAVGGPVSVLEQQDDDTLVITDLIPVDRGVDNLALDSDGVLWGAGLPEALKLVYQHFSDPSIPVSSSALRISQNSGEELFYGKKYKVEKAFEDDGHLASGATSAVWDAERRNLFLHGLASPQLAVCKL